MSDYGSKPVFEVRAAKNGEALCDYYRAAFKKRFFTEPILELDDTDIMRWLARHIGDNLERGKDIIEVYFTLTDKEFVENAYTPFWLKKKINRILSAVGQRNAALGSTRTLYVRPWVYCSNMKCQKPNYGQFEIVCNALELEKSHYCRQCALEIGATTLEYIEPSASAVTET